MQEINVYVKGVVYQNKGKGFALSAWAVKGEPVHFIEHEVNSAYHAESVAIRDAVETKGADDTILHIFSNQKAMIDSLNKMQYQHHQYGSEFDLIPQRALTECDFVWCPLKESPADLLRLREMAMQEVDKRGKACEKV